MLTMNGQIRFKMSPDQDEKKILVNAFGDETSIDFHGNVFELKDGKAACNRKALEDLRKWFEYRDNPMIEGSIVIESSRGELGRYSLSEGEYSSQPGWKTDFSEIPPGTGELSAQFLEYLQNPENRDTIVHMAVSLIKSLDLTAEECRIISDALMQQEVMSGN